MIVNVAKTGGDICDSCDTSADAAALLANIAAYRAPIWRNLGLKCSSEPVPGGALAKKANNRETPGDNCDSCDKPLHVSGSF